MLFEQDLSQDTALKQGGYTKYSQSTQKYCIDGNFNILYRVNQKELEALLEVCGTLDPNLKIVINQVAKILRICNLVAVLGLET